MFTVTTGIQSIAEELMRQKNELFIKSIKQLIDKGLLQIRQSEMIIVESYAKDKYEMKMSYEIVSKEHEYIERIEKKCDELEQKLARIKLEFV